MKKPVLKNRTKIHEHLLSRAPNESGGFILKDGTWVPLENVYEESSKPAETAHHAPDTAFLLPFKEYKKYSRDIAYIVHSHITDDWDNNGPSLGDQSAQAATAVPWWVFVICGDKVKDDYLFDEHRASGVKYRPAIRDEASVVEEYYRLNRYKRQRGWNDKPDYLIEYSNHLIFLEGFTVRTEETEHKPGDIILGGNDPEQHPDTICIVDNDGKYRYHHQTLKATKTCPCPVIHRTLYHD